MEVEKRRRIEAFLRSPVTLVGKEPWPTVREYLAAMLLQAWNGQSAPIGGRRPLLVAADRLISSYVDDKERYEEAAKLVEETIKFLGSTVEQEELP